MQNHPAEVEALAAVVRAAFADLNILGKKINPHALAAIDLVEQWLSGIEISAAALTAAASTAHEDNVPLAQREKDRALSWANTAAGNLAYVALKRRTWKDDMATVTDAAVYALESLGKSSFETRAAYDMVRANALRAFDPKKSKLKADREKPAHRPSEADLKTILTEFKYPAHAPVIAFEKKYGAFKFKEAGDEQDLWLFGAYACLKSGAHKNPRGRPDLKGSAALVPVVYSPNDVIYFLDGNGAAWVEDTIEGELEKFADDATAMIARIKKGVS